MYAILDNPPGPQDPRRRDLARGPPTRWQFHFTPTHASWLNQSELPFSILSRRLLKRGAFKSKADLRAQLLAFIERYNPPAKPFAWTYAGKPLVQVNGNRRTTHQ